ncbi:ComEC/Rec2 family competence protein [Nocardioides donggukensis]|uniref:ComEC/Rec2 family competence protein n=1 Tax=Nocardioides donggukensis TaxID=2774019 RepID=A0A927K6H4_9ACTN|nr:ComEC/Rec2 family competence protein [Nocardioides donggukensis]MBD8870035.1 ComEC/Rec2 family competence protein [Nocardioides donggukensis]
MTPAALAATALIRDQPDPARPRDLRMVALGTAAWLGGIAGLTAPPLLLGAPLVALAVVLGPARRRVGIRRLVAGALLAALSVGGSAVLRDAGVAAGVVAELAGSRAAGQVRLTVTTDPRRLRDSRAERYLVRGTVHTVATVARSGPGGTGVWSVHTPVLVIGDRAWADVRLGSTVLAPVRLGPADGGDLAAVAVARGAPRVVAEPSLAWRGSAALRAAIRAAVADARYPARALVPALVDGDDQDLPARLHEQFRTAGLTHLLAVSGTNLTLVVGFLLVLGRWCGVRGRWLHVLGALGIAGFILLARTEPSVVRAAAMGTVALIGIGANSRDRGVRALGVAVLGLLLWDPWLATRVGFALSVLATAGILLLAPGWVRAMTSWLPRPAAEAVAVPAAAQLAVTPVIAGISGQVSLVAVGANLLAAPLVAPATVLGLLGGVVGLVLPPAGSALGRVATWSAAGIVAVAEHAAGLPLPAIEWGTRWSDLVLLTAICGALTVTLGPLLARRASGLACGAALAVAVLVPVPTPGWPPPGWLLVACDVGQGDALVLNAGPGSAVVVDAGPDPLLVDRCLSRLGVEEVPLVVLTHFHADHVAGLSGVLEGRGVGEVAVTGLREPAQGAAEVGRAAGARTRVPGYAESRTVGAVRLQVVGPLPGGSAAGSAAEDGSAANNASLVLLAEVSGVRILLTGDVEPEAQRLLARSLPGLEVDVLKVPHHGSRHQDHDFLASLGARVVVASVGADNDYGHPAAETLEPLAAGGAEVRRTDADGDVAVLLEEGALTVRTSR